MIYFHENEASFITHSLKEISISVIRRHSSITSHFKRVRREQDSSLPGTTKNNLEKKFLNFQILIKKKWELKLI